LLNFDLMENAGSNDFRLKHFISFQEKKKYVQTDDTNVFLEIRRIQSRYREWIQDIKIDLLGKNPRIN
jgi:hypothetical protein